MNEEGLVVNPCTDEQRIKDSLRGEPIFKLLVTLSTTMLGLTMVFAHRFAIEQSGAIFALAIAPIMFLSSIACSFYVLTAIAFFDPEHGRKRWLEGKFELGILVVSIFGFLLGLFCLGLASYLNYLKLIH